MKHKPAYYLWNIGCQMNKAESERLSAYLESLGYVAAARPDGADLVLLNTCVVRGSAEQRVLGELSALKGHKIRNPGVAIAVTGCFVDSKPEELRRRFPHIDVAFGAGEFADFQRWMESVAGLPTGDTVEYGPLPAIRSSVTAYVPVIRGCNNFCTYCIVPYRRGRERSRPLTEVVSEVERLVAGGVKETTLLGQNINSYGGDLPGNGDLADLLARLNAVEGLLRIRFITSHPRDVSAKFIRAMAELDKVCEYISLPAQSGDDRVLKAMRRGYTSGEYRKLVAELRRAVPGISVSTDVIVGFPGETEEEFRNTAGLLSSLRFETVHVAAYSSRPGTLAEKTMADDVSREEKARRLRDLEEAQERVAFEENRSLVGQRVEVLVEGTEKGKWQGRTRGNKLVFFTDPGEWRGRLVEVEVTAAGPWSLRGTPAPAGVMAG